MPKEQKLEPIDYIHENLVRLRKMRRFPTAEAAAAAIGCTPSELSFWEHARRLPSTISILRIADAYGVTTDRVLRPPKTIGTKKGRRPEKGAAS